MRRPSNTDWSRPPARHGRSSTKLNRALRLALDSEEVRKRLANDGAEPTPSTPEEHAVLLEQEEAKWSRLAHEIGLKPE